MPAVPTERKAGVSRCGMRDTASGAARLFRLTCGGSVHVRRTRSRFGEPTLKPSIAPAQNIEAARAAARLHRATNPRIIGSVLHDTDTDGSDLDLLVDVRPV